MNSRRVPTDRLTLLPKTDSYWPQRDESEPRQTVKEYVDDLKEIENSGLIVPSRYEVMDVAGKSFNADEERNYFDAYRDEGVYFQPAKKNRDLSGYDWISQALRPKPLAKRDPSGPFQKVKGAAVSQQPLVKQEDKMVAGVRFELTTFGL